MRMPKRDFKADVIAYNKEIREALQTMYDALNQGQRKKIIKTPEVKALFDRYGIDYEDK